MIKEKPDPTNGSRNGYKANHKIKTYWAETMSKIDFDHKVPSQSKIDFDHKSPKVETRSRMNINYNIFKSINIEKMILSYYEYNKSKNNVYLTVNKTVENSDIWNKIVKAKHSWEFYQKEFKL
jgi:hypothetical protein